MLWKILCILRGSQQNLSIFGFRLRTGYILYLTSVCTRDSYAHCVLPMVRRTKKRRWLSVSVNISSVRSSIFAGFALYYPNEKMAPLTERCGPLDESSARIWLIRKNELIGSIEPVIRNEDVVFFCGLQPQPSDNQTFAFRTNIIGGTPGCFLKQKAILMSYRVQGLFEVSNVTRKNQPETADVLARYGLL